MNIRNGSIPISVSTLLKPRNILVANRQKCAIAEKI